MKKRLSISLITALTITQNAGCTGQLLEAFRYLQQTETFSASQSVNTKVDILWVVDNSSSMDASQNKIRNGFSTFAQKYLKPTWDIQVAVITTDTYMANSAFTQYLNTLVPSSTGYTSAHIVSRLGTFQNPTWNTSLVNLGTGALDSGIKYGELVPLWGANYAKLQAGIHDGPITAFCFEGMPYFLKGSTLCDVRDDQVTYSGTSHCLSPNTGAGETALSQCVNTVENDTVRSGKAIIKTKPPTGTAGDATWVQNLINDFSINVSVGSAGQGSERGLGSLQQFLADNETSATAFFRSGSQRVIIFVSDEEDQTMTYPTNPAASFKPFTDYKCDQASLAALNPTANITGANGYCCAGNGCTYGDLGTSCPSKTVDGYTYTPSICPDTSKLVSVASVKAQLDSFFTNLDSGQNPAVTSTNYFVSNIVPLTAATIQSLQADRDVTDTAAGIIKTKAADRADRYIALADAVGNGSSSMDIGSTNYDAILDAIGRAFIEKAGTFTLGRVPTGYEDMIVKVLHTNGTETVLSSSQFQIQSNKIIFTDVDLILTMSTTDTIVINYQPKAPT